MYYEKAKVILLLMFWIPVALVWDLFFAVITLVYKSCTWIDHTVGVHLDAWRERAQKSGLF